MDPGRDSSQFRGPTFKENLKDWVSSIFDHLGAKIISVAMGIVLWVFVLGSRSVEVTKDVPLDIVVAPGLVAANDVPDRISFRLKGPKAFLRAVLDRKDDLIRVNFTGAKPGIQNYKFFKDHLRVPIGVTVLSVAPENILVRLDAVSRRDVPVKLDLKGTVPEGFRVVKAEVRPAVVRISGAESRVEGVTEVVTKPYDISKLRRTVEEEISLDLGRQGLSVDGPLPRVKVEVVALSANVKVKGVPVGVISDFKARVTPSQVVLLVRMEGGSNAKPIDRNAVKVFIDLTGKPKGQYNGLAPQVVVPPNLGFFKSIPERVNVTLY